MKQCPFKHLAQSAGHHNRHKISRRAFLQSAGLAAAGLAVAGCQGILPGGAGGKTTVAVAKAASYDPKLVRKQVEAVLDGIGGVSDILAHGNRVAIKTNLTGGTRTQPLPGISEIESYLTHPEVVKALCELLRDAGVKDLFIVEAVYEQESWPHYGYQDMAKAIGATLVDLNDPAPYGEFIKVTATTEKPMYDEYVFHPILKEIDAFVSVSKMKCHNVAGVTHTMKNLFGLVPLASYRNSPNDTYRSAFHGSTAQSAGERVPPIIVDLNTARPVNLSLIDGILTTEAGEGPWIQALTPVQPGLLFAGKDPVATDSVATVAMGFDPTADYPNEPFVNGVNHIKLAAEAGLGTNRMEEIKVVGAKLDDVTLKFTPSY
jgi:uncharacterized protein (DUF362 family)